MFVNAVIVEQLEHDGNLRSFTMWTQPRRPLTAGFPDEHDSSGPFYFPDEYHQKAFEKGFAGCRMRKLPKSRFIAIDGDTIFKNSWAGIPTALGVLSFYALSLPEFAVPSLIEFKNPRSQRRYPCTVIRDDHRNRFVAYLGCRSSHETFDFSLQVNFRSDRGAFRNAEYSDQHTTNQLERIPDYQHVVPETVRQFFSQVPPSQATLSFVNHGISGEQSVSRAAAKSSPTDKLPAKKTDMSRYFDVAKLTERQREVGSLHWEYALPVAEIARRLELDRKTVQEHLDAVERKVKYKFSRNQPLEEIPDLRSTEEVAEYSTEEPAKTPVDSE